MAHQVLARKWRPRDFTSLVGQEHVVRALSHALSSQRLHHAYLFTGTRGVGKTTIARILAKALNCETGVTATPCGVCRACNDIDAGRFVDYLELDAASNRGVDEMAQVLENAAYAPAIGRYKVFVIDEVHMLTNHAFNSMLKTLEEPPGHVVFVLATTDPQKVPVTVLSRCLQFNLKNMAPPAIAGYLAKVLTAESIGFEPAALPPIGRAAAGSMRDALSLLDQAIAYGGGTVAEQAVLEMLGVVDRRYLTRVIDALLAADGAALVALADEMLANNMPFERTLQELSALLQRIALAQVGAFGEDDDRAMLERYAAQMAAEDLQVYYQVVIHGARDLPLAVDAHSGFAMILLRLLAFKPAGDAADNAVLRSSGASGPASAAAASGRAGALPNRALPAAARAAAASTAALPTASAASPPELTAPAAPAVQGSRRSFDGDWPKLAASLPVTGFALQFMQQSELVGYEDLNFKVRVPIRPLAEAPTVGKVKDALSAFFGRPVRLAVEVGGVSGVTAAAVASQAQSERLAKAQASLESDPFVQTLISEFDGRIVPDSVRATSNK